MEIVGLAKPRRPRKPKKPKYLIPPGDLSPESLQIWKDMHEEWGKSLTGADHVTLTVALHALDRLNEARAIVNLEGKTIESKRSGLKRAHPLLATEKAMYAAFSTFWTALGLFESTGRRPVGRPEGA